MISRHSGWRGPPQSSKNRSENLGCNFGFQPIPGVASRIAPRIGFSHDFGLECNSGNALEFRELLKNGVFTLRAFFVKLVVVPRLPFHSKGCMYIISHQSSDLWLLIGGMEPSLVAQVILDALSVLWGRLSRVVVVLRLARPAAMWPNKSRSDTKLLLPKNYFEIIIF